MRILLRSLLILCFLALMCFVPVIPLLDTSLESGAQPEMVSRSLFELASQPAAPASGAALTWEWYSYAGLVLLLAIMAAFSLLIARLRL